MPLGRIGSERGFPPSGAVEDLSNEALAARRIAVGFDPHRTPGLPTTLADTGGDPLEQRRRVLPDPAVLLGLAAEEPEVGATFHQTIDRRERPEALSTGLRERPEPGGVDVGVADGDAGGSGPAVPARAPEQRFERGELDVEGGPRIVGGDPSEDRAQPGLQLLGPRDVGGMEQHGASGEIPRLHEAPGSIVVGHQLRRRQSARLVLAPPRLHFGVVPPERRHAEWQVARRLDQQVDVPVALAGREERRSIPIEVESMMRRTIPPQERFGPGVEAKMDLPPSHRVGDPAAKSEPGGAPDRSPSPPGGHRRECGRVEPGDFGV